MVLSSEDKITSEVLSVITVDPEVERESYVKAILHVGKDNYYLNMISSLYVKRDYLNYRSDFVEITFQIPLGDFVFHIYPERDDISISISYYSLGDLTTRQYHVVLGDYDKDIRSNKYMNMKQDDLNNHLATIKAECTSKLFLSLKKEKTQNIFRETTVENALILTMAKYLRSASYEVGEMPGHLVIISPDNTRKYKHIDIPNNTPLLDVPKTLQEGSFGIYNGDVNIYLQSFDSKNNMYIFPKYRPNLITFNKKILYIIGVDSTTLIGVKATYAMSNDMLKIVVMKTEKFFDDDSKLKSEGVGTISLNTDALLSRPFRVSKDKLEVKRDYLIEKSQHKEIKSGVVDYKNKGKTNNLYQDRTEVLANDGMVVQFDWHHSDFKLLYPMMPVVYVYESDNAIFRHEGLLQRTDTVIDSATNTENSKLSVFFNKKGELNV